MGCNRYQKSHRRRESRRRAPARLPQGAADGLFGPGPVYRIRPDKFHSPQHIVVEIFFIPINADIGTLVGPGGKSLLATVVKL